MKKLKNNFFNFFVIQNVWMEYDDCIVQIKNKRLIKYLVKEYFCDTIKVVK